MGLRQYETMTVLRDGMGEETDKLIERLERTVEKLGGKISEVNNWGPRKLAYPINKQPTGVYVLFKYGSPPTIIKEFERTMKLIENVLKFMTIQTEEALTEEEFNSIEKVRKEAEQPAQEAEQPAQEAEPPTQEAEQPAQEATAPAQEAEQPEKEDEIPEDTDMKAESASTEEKPASSGSEETDETSKQEEAPDDGAIEAEPKAEEE